MNSFESIAHEVVAFITRYDPYLIGDDEVPEVLNRTAEDIACGGFEVTKWLRSLKDPEADALADRIREEAYVG